MRQIAVIALLCLGPLFLTAPAWADGPSFDCAKAGTPVEKAICASGDLSALDRQIADEYKAAVSAGDTTITEQRAWLAQRDKICAPENTADCLRQVLLDRHASLSNPDKYEANADGSGAINGFNVDVIADETEREKRIVEFNDPSNPHHNRDSVVMSCEGEVLEVFAGRNVSYGAVCTIDRGGAKTKAIVCNDEMVGHYHTQDVADRKIGRKEIAGFIARNCISG